MIKVEITTAVALYLSFSLLLVFMVWIFYNYSTKSNSYENKDLQQCPYCTHVFQSYKKDSILTCPQCHSYIEQEDGSEEGAKT